MDIWSENGEKMILKLKLQATHYPIPQSSTNGDFNPTPKQSQLLHSKYDHSCLHLQLFLFIATCEMTSKPPHLTKHVNEPGHSLTHYII